MNLSSRLGTLLFVVALVCAVSTSTAYASNPAAPFTPSQNIQDPGSGSTPGTGGTGCSPTDSNCYIDLNAGAGSFTSVTVSGTTTLQAVTATNATTTSLFSTTASSTNLFATSATIGTLGLGTLTLTNALAVTSGGTGTSTAPTFGQILVGNGSGGYTLLATSSLGITGASSTTNVASSTGNVLGTSVSGNYASTSIINTAIASSSVNLFNVVVNGISSTLASIINSFTQSVTGNVLTSTVNGVAATTSVISSNSFTTGGNIATSTVNGVASASSIITSNALSFATSSSLVTSTINGVATNATILANFANGVFGTLTVPNGGTGSTTLTGLLKGNGTGSLLSAVAGTDYQAPITTTYPINFSANTLSLAFGTTTANTWSSLQTLSSGFISSASSTIGNGTQTTGLTISGGATTTGNSFFGGTGKFNSTLALGTVLTCTGGNALQTDASGNISCGAISVGGASTGGGWTTNNIGRVTVATSTDLVVVGASTTPYAKFAILSGSNATTTLALIANTGQTANILDLYTAGGSLASVITAGGSLGLGTTTPGSLLSLGGIANFATATSTFYSTGGINLTAGCFAVGGNCLTLGSLGGTLSIANGGTATSTQVTNGINYFDGTRITSGTALTFNGTTLTTPGYVSTASSTVVGAFTTTGATALGSTLGVTGLSTLTSGFISNASSTIVGAQTVTGNVAIGGTLTTTGVATLASTLAVSGTSTFATTTAASSTITNANISNLFAAVLNAASSVFTSLFATTANITTLFATTTNATTTNTGTLTATGATSLQELTATNATTTNIFSTTASSTNLFSTSANIGTLTLTGTTTAGNGVNITTGCFAVNGTCLATPSSLLTSANTWSSLQTFTGGYIDNASSTHTAFTQFTNASTTGFTNTGSTWFSSLTNALLSTDSTGKLVATTSIGTNLLTGTLAVGNGGTGSTTLTGLLKGNGTGSLLSAVAGTDYQAPITATYPINFSANTLSLAFGTTTANTWSSLQTLSSGFISNASSTIVGASTVTGATTLGSTLAVSGNTTLANATSTNFFSTTASSTNLFAQTASFGALTLGTGTTTAGNGVNITAGCFSVAGSCLSLSNFSGTLAIANGGTNATAQTTNGVNYFDGTKITSGTGLTFDGTNLGIGSSTPSKQFTFALGNPASGVGQAPFRIGVNPAASSAAVEIGAATGGYSMIQGLSGSSGFANQLFLNPFGGSVSIGTTTTPGAIFSVTGGTYLTGGLGVGLINNTTGTLNVSSTGTFGSVVNVNLATAALNFTNLSKSQATNDTGAYEQFNGGAAGGTVRGYLGFTKTGTGGSTFFTVGELADAFAIRSQGAFQLGTNGNNIALTVDTSQRLGIGTTTPTGNLVINGTTGQNLFQIATSTNQNLMVMNQNGNVSIATSSSVFPFAVGNAFVTAGGVWTNASDRNLKENFTSVAPGTILGNIMQLPITQWNYKVENASVKHLGPVAQDFFALFGLGGSDTSISTIDPAGIALIGIQAQQSLLGTFASSTATSTATGQNTLIADIQAETTRDVVGFFTTKINAGAQFLTDFVGARVTAIRGYFDEVFANRVHTKQLCVSDTNGETCITKTQLDTLLAGAGGSGGGGGGGSGNQAPVITVDPVTVSTSTSATTYNISTGVTVTDDHDSSVTLMASLDGGATTTAVSIAPIDLSVVGNHTIIYSASDAQNAQATPITRTVTVQ